MKLSQLLITTSFCALTALPAVAQGRAFSDIDTDGNGELSAGELDAIFGAAVAGTIIARRGAGRNLSPIHI